MLLRGSIAALAFALSALSGSPNAHADEAYVCDTGRVVYVKMGELEAMKHSDPCIASYYGITLPPAGSAPVASEPSTPPVEFKTLDAPENQSSIANPRALKVAVAEAPVARHRAPPVAAPDTDFRNVRLINGGAQSDGWYRHTR